jgi:hypothetical protein
LHYIPDVLELSLVASNEAIWAKNSAVASAFANLGCLGPYLSAADIRAAGENRMAKNRPEVRIPMQVGTEVRIRSNGDIILDNPELELAADTTAADAVLSYRFDSESGEHVLRLLDPVAERSLRPTRKAG